MSPDDNRKSPRVSLIGLTRNPARLCLDTCVGYSLMKTRVIAIVFMVVGGCASSKPAPALPVGRSLLDIFVSVLAEVKAGTSIPVLLPTELPGPFSGAKNAIVEKVSADEYAVDLYYELGAGQAGFAASFSATNNAGYSPQELPNVRKVKLAGGAAGYFSPVSCGGSCAPANIWWERGAVLYQIQLKLPSVLSEKRQQRIITVVAGSAILAGPR